MDLFLGRANGAITAPRRRGGPLLHRFQSPIARPRSGLPVPPPSKSWPGDARSPSATVLAGRARAPTSPPTNAIRKCSMPGLLCASIALWLATQPIHAQSPLYVVAPSSGDSPLPDTSIEPPSGPLVALPPQAPSMPPPLTSFYVLPRSTPPDIALTDDTLMLPPPPTVVIQQLPPVILTRTCWHDNYYAYGRRYHHGRTHCSQPE